MSKGRLLVLCAVLALVVTLLWSSRLEQAWAAIAGPPRLPSIHSPF